MIHCGEHGHALLFSLVHSFRIDNGIFPNMPTLTFILHTFSYAMHIVYIFCNFASAFHFTALTP